MNEDKELEIALAAAHFIKMTQERVDKGIEAIERLTERFSDDHITHWLSYLVQKSEEVFGEKAVHIINEVTKNRLKNGKYQEELCQK
jgi:hypothetical protein